MKYEKKSKIDDLFPSDHSLPYRTQSRPIHENKKGTMEPAHDRALKNADSPLMLPAFFYEIRTYSFSFAGACGLI